MVTWLAAVAPPLVAVQLKVVPVVSAGEGFRSLDAGSLLQGGSPYSQVTSVEAGFRSEVARGRYVMSLTAFQTDVANEVSFDATEGGLSTEGASTRRGVVASVMAKPVAWLFASSALSLQTATYDTFEPSTGHYVPDVPAFLWRTDVNVHGELLRGRGAPYVGRLGVGYTLLGGRHVVDSIVAPTNNVVNLLASLRHGSVEFGVDVYNALGLQYADDTFYYVSNWSVRSGLQPASAAIHTVAAAPQTLLGTLTLYL